MDTSLPSPFTPAPAPTIKRLPPMRSRSMILALDELARRHGATEDLESRAVFSFGLEPAAAGPAGGPPVAGADRGAPALSWRLAAFRAAATLAATGAMLLASNSIPANFMARVAGARADWAPPPAALVASRIAPAGVATAADAARPLPLPRYDLATMRPSAGFWDYLKDKEGLRLVSYLDPGGVWTIGYGHTGVMPDGRPIGKGMRITEDQALAFLRADIEASAQGVRDLLGQTPVTQSQFDALVDFAFNKGLPNLEGSTLLAQVRQGDYLGSADEFLRWIYVTQKDAHGNPVRGADGKLIATVEPALQARAQDNYTMMRAGFSSKCLAALEERRAHDAPELRALKQAQVAVGAVHPGAGPAQSAQQLAQTLQRVQRPLGILEKRLKEQDAALAQLEGERRQDAQLLHTHAAKAAAHVSVQQGQALIDLVSQVAVLDRLIAQQRAARTDTLAQQQYWKNLNQVLVESSTLLREGAQLAAKSALLASQAAPAPSRVQLPGQVPAAMGGRLGALAQAWRTLAHDAPPAGVISPVPAQTAHALFEQTNTLARTLTADESLAALSPDDDDASAPAWPRPRG